MAVFPDPSKPLVGVYDPEQQIEKQAPEKEPSSSSTGLPDFFKAQILSVDPATHTCTIQAYGSNEERSGVPIMRSALDPDLRGGQTSLPKPGAIAVCNNCLPGEPPFIIGYLPESSARQAPHGETDTSQDPGDAARRSVLTLASTAFGKDDPLHARTGEASYLEGQGADMAPGDWSVQSTDGNGLGVLEGGVTVFRANDLAQILGFKVGDLIRIVARNFELFTDLGELKLTSEAGKASFSFKGSTELRDANPEKDDWNIECGMGEPGTLFYLRFLGPSKKVLAGLTVSPAGDIAIEGNSIVERSSSGAEGGAQAKASSNLLIKGSDTKDVGADHARSATNFTRTAGSAIKDTSQTKHTTVTGDHLLSASHTSQETISGFRLEKDMPMIQGGVTGKKIDVVNGNYKVQVGSPASNIPSPIYPKSHPSIIHTVHTGDILNTISTMGSFIVSATAVGAIRGVAFPYSIVLNSPRVLLGGPGATGPLTTDIPIPAPAGAPACKFDMLLLYLNKLHTKLDTHIHKSSSGPTDPPLVPFTLELAPLAAAIASLTVSIAS